MIATKASGSNLAAMALIVFSATKVDVAAAVCLPDENDVKMLVQPSVKYVEITIINESVCDVMISPNVRLFRELQIFMTQGGGRVGFKKMGHSEADVDNVSVLSPNSFVGTRIYYSALSEYVKFGAGCYESMFSYVYRYERNALGMRRITSGKVIELCFKNTGVGLEYVYPK